MKRRWLCGARAMAPCSGPLTHPGTWVGRPLLHRAARNCSGDSAAVGPKAAACSKYAYLFSADSRLARVTWFRNLGRRSSPLAGPRSRRDQGEYGGKRASRAQPPGLIAFLDSAPWRGAGECFAAIAVVDPRYLQPESLGVSCAPPGRILHSWASPGAALAGASLPPAIVLSPSGTNR